MPTDPQHVLRDESTGDDVGYLYQSGNGNVVIEHADSGETIAVGSDGIQGDTFDASGALKAPVYSDNANAIQEDESLWYNDGTGPDPSGYYGYDGGTIVGPFGSGGVENPLTEALDADGNDITGVGSLTTNDLTIDNVETVAYRSSNQTISNQTETKIQFDVTAVDDDGRFNSSNYTIDATESGKYAIRGQWQWNNVGSGNLVFIFLKVNGSQVGFNRRTAQGDFAAIAAYADVELSAGDSVSMAVRQDSGSDGDAVGGRQKTKMTVQRVG